MEHGKFFEQRLSLVTLCVLLLAGCSDSGVHNQPGTPASTTLRTVTPSPTLDPQALPALEAYAAYNRASAIALQNPVAKGKKYPAGGDFTRYSIDPERSNTRILMWSLVAGGAHYHGTPPKSHTKVKAINLTALNGPKVILTDCPSGLDNWNAIYVATGKKVRIQTGKVPPPYLSTVTVIKYEGRWAVQTVNNDTSLTCVS